MPTFQGFGEFVKALDKAQYELSGAEKRRITREMGRAAQKVAKAEASKDVGGDLQMRGWPRATLTTKLKTDSEGATVVLPTSKLSAAGWTVQTDGRYAQGGVGRFQGPGLNMRTGATTRTKTGKISNRKRKAKRWNGYTRGKGTADRAQVGIDRAVSKIADDGVRTVLRKHVDVT